LAGWTDEKGNTFAPGECLVVRRGELSGEALSALLRDLPPTLQTLNLWYNSIGADGAGALKLPPTLQSLNLYNNSIGADGAGALKLPPTLQSLNLYNNSIGDVGAGALKLPPTLQSLDLGGNSIGDESAGALKLPPTLQTLDLSDNSIGDVGTGALKLPPTLQSLRLWNNFIGDVGAGALKLPPTLQSLDLSGNSIGADGAGALKLPPTLQSLNLYNNSIGDVGAGALKLPPTLQTLDLSANSIGDVGAGAIIAAFSDQLTTLDLTDNNISLVSTSVLQAYHSRPAALKRLWLDQKFGQIAPVARAVILGNGGAGKSHLAEWIVWGLSCRPGQEPMPKPEFDRARTATHAFVRRSVEVPLNFDGVEKSADLNIYDFGGQVQIHESSRWFMSEKRNIFIILVSGAQADGHGSRVDAAGSHEPGRSLEYYLRMAHFHGASQPVIVVAGWSDAPRHPDHPATWPDEQELRKIHPNTVVVKGFNAKGQGAEDVAAAVRQAMAGPEMMGQIKQPVGELFRIARNGVRAKAAKDPLCVWAAERGRGAWYPALFAASEKYKTDTELQHAAVLMLRDVGEVHYVSDTRLRLRDAKGAKPEVRANTRAEDAADRLKQVFFMPDAVKGPVCSVLREPDKACPGWLSGDQLRARLSEAGLPEGDEEKVIDLMEASELIYRGSGDDERWLVPDHLPSATREQRREVLDGWEAVLVRRWTPSFVPDSVLWRYLARMGGAAAVPIGGGLYKDWSYLEPEGRKFLLMAFPDAREPSINVYAERAKDPADRDGLERLAAKIEQGLNEALGIDPYERKDVVTRPVPTREERCWELQRELDRYCKDHAQYFFGEGLRVQRKPQRDAMLAQQFLLRKEVPGGGGGRVLYKAVMLKNAEPEQVVSLKFEPYDTANDSSFRRLHLEFTATRDRSMRDGIARAEGWADDVRVTSFPVAALARRWVIGDRLIDWAQGKSLAERMRVFLEVCEGVKKLHESELIHRDLKPGNILVEDGHAVIIDLGAIKDLRVVGGLTEDGHTGPLTPGYAAPEQYGVHAMLGLGDGIGPHTDVFALGVILKELVKGAEGEPGTLGRIDAAVFSATRPAIDDWREPWQEAVDRFDDARREDWYNVLSNAIGGTVPTSTRPAAMGSRLRTVDALVRLLQPAINAQA
jgi:hypothetical protein